MASRSRPGGPATSEFIVPHSMIAFAALAASLWLGSRFHEPAERLVGLVRSFRSLIPPLATTVLSLWFLLLPEVRDHYSHFNAGLTTVLAAVSFTSVMFTVNAAIQLLDRILNLPPATSPPAG